jgi:hypothetical protein
MVRFGQGQVEGGQPSLAGSRELRQVCIGDLAMTDDAANRDIGIGDVVDRSYRVRNGCYRTVTSVG